MLLHSPGRASEGTQRKINAQTDAPDDERYTAARLTRASRISTRKLYETSNGLARHTRVTDKYGLVEIYLKKKRKRPCDLRGAALELWSSATILKTSGGSAPEPAHPSRRCAY